MVDEEANDESRIARRGLIVLLASSVLYYACVIVSVLIGIYSSWIIGLAVGVIGASLSIAFGACALIHTAKDMP